jgi:hypothetical protein
VLCADSPDTQQNASWLSNDVLHMFEFHSFSLMSGGDSTAVAAATASGAAAAPAKAASGAPAKAASGSPAKSTAVVAAGSGSGASPAGPPVFALLRHIFPDADARLLTLLQR